jgi:crossover junction endodeoxyribonuclease RuvC
MPLIVGIDPSLTSTGMCRIDVEPGGDPVNQPPLIQCATVVSKARADKSYAAMSARIGLIAENIIDGCRDADLVVIEGPAFNAKGAHTHSRDWLWGKLFDGITALGIQIVVVTPSGRMKYATGKGNAAKDLVLAAAIKRWPIVDIQGNDQADAVILASMGCRYLGFPIETLPAINVEAMTKVAA